MRNRAALGLALVAILAIATVAASAGHADEEGVATFTTDSGTTVMDWTKLADAGAGKINALTVAKQSVLCKKAVFTGEIKGKQVTQIEVTPEYSECTTETGLFVTVKHNECKYVFHVGVKLAEGQYEGSFDVICPAGKEFEVTTYANAEEKAPFCTVTVGTQKGLKAPLLTNQKGAKEVEDKVLVEGTVEEIQYHTNGFACGNQEAKTGIRHLYMTVSGTDAEGAKSGIRLSGG
jgi:hypothetical protein